MRTLKLELVDGKYKLSKKTNNTWNFMLLSEAELRKILKLIEEQGVDIVETLLRGERQNGGRNLHDSRLK